MIDRDANKTNHRTMVELYGNANIGRGSGDGLGRHPPADDARQQHRVPPPWSTPAAVGSSTAPAPAP